MPKVLTIAGSDCSGGAGIQADLKTMLANDVYGMSVITSLTAQNTQGVSDIAVMDGEFIKAQLEAVCTDIFPNAIKIGMVGGREQIRAIAEYLQKIKAPNIVVDPVMVATSGSKLLPDEAIAVMKKELFPFARVITPNLQEASLLYGKSIGDEKTMREAAETLAKQYGVAVLVKGGHLISDALDVLADGDEVYAYSRERVDNDNTHGTGCTLSSAIACNLAKGFDLETAVKRAKEYITALLHSNLNLGGGSGPLDHGYLLRRKLNEG